MSVAQVWLAILVVAAGVAVVSVIGVWAAAASVDMLQAVAHRLHRA